MDEKKMTKWSKEELVCPQCGHVNMVKKYALINASEKPALKEDILKNRIFVFECEHCGLKTPLTYPSVYLDSKKKRLILMTPEPEEEAKKSFGQWEQMKGYHKRYVNNINDLKEKIMIAENHLDDRVIELVKIEYIRQLEKEMKDDTMLDILFDYSGNQMYFVVFFEKKGVGRMPLSLDFYRQIERQYASRLAAHPTDDFQKIDMEWAGTYVFQRS